VAYTACFRHEQFSAGRDVRGIKRGFQFDKVEMVQFVEEDDSWNALDRLLGHAVEIVAALGLRYRVIRLASADLTFASAMTYDIEVWAPGAQEWLEVSSVSNFLDFQARRANLRYRGADGKVRFLHTLNGSGVALPAPSPPSWSADASRRQHRGAAGPAPVPGRAGGAAEPVALRG
jgi:seryl-tRNA synthetase